MSMSIVLIIFNLARLERTEEDNDEVEASRGRVEADGE